MSNSKLISSLYRAAGGQAARIGVLPDRTADDSGGEEEEEDKEIDHDHR